MFPAVADLMMDNNLPCWGLSSRRLRVVRLLRGALRHLQHDDADGHRRGPVHGDHQAARLPGGDVSQEGPEHPGHHLGLLHGLEPPALLWLE